MDNTNASLRWSYCFGLLIVTSMTYGFYVLCWRIFFHPLRDFPGPKLAAATLWYEFYYDVILGGQYVFQIARMHEVYGKRFQSSAKRLGMERRAD